MSLLNRVANREIMDFLKTLTIKSTYFADRARSLQIRPQIEARVPETANPYTIHLAGEYILDDYKITDPVNERYPKDDKYWPTKDRKRNEFKNYWRKIDVATFQRVPPSEMMEISDPQEAGLYEIKPLYLGEFVNPITGLKEKQYYYRSQLIYDREGCLSQEVRNTEYLNDDCYDQMMFVTSLDTNQEIPFTLANFYIDEANEAVALGLREHNAIHTKTLEAYRVPGRYFDLLCKKYPKQVDLIKAIVYRVPGHEISSLVTIPELENMLISHGFATHEYIQSLETRFPNKRDLQKKLGEDIDGARRRSGMSLSEYRRTRIAKAKNFTLLNHDYSMLDSTERISLLEHVHKVLDIIRRRWAINEYNFEENYAATLWTVLWTVLPTALIAKRFANIKTPYVSEAHMWDYLNSKGLASYRGYLTTEQTWFLYKNIEYLIQHRAQQKALNILVDNILADYGLTIKAKTVVLDTSDSLKVGATPTSAQTQCATCSRHNVTCFKNMTENLCDEWLGTKTLCKAEPMVLTEEFAGASEEKILRQLVSAYGYSEEDAKVKYKRSFIWRDDEIEAIKDDLNRDQLVNIDAPVDTLENTIEIEHASGLEPVFNEDVVDQQRKELQHMHGTYAPTKLLEMSKRRYNAKFAELFNRFITETLLRFAPKRRTDGTLSRKVTCSYHFTTAEGAGEYIFSFGEMLAAGYLGFVREYTVDSVVDIIAKTEDGSRPLYVRVQDFNHPLHDENGYIPIGKKPDGSIIYLTKLSSWAQKRFTDFMNKATYDFIIPDRCLTSTALKFGKPVMQSELIDTWIKFDGSTSQALLTRVTNRDAATKILMIRKTFYAVTELEEPERFCRTLDDVAKGCKRYYIEDEMAGYILADVKAGDDLTKGTYFEEDSIWSEFTVRLKILGEFVKETVGYEDVFIYYENNEEIPLIPKYFKWYHTHLNPDIDKDEEEHEATATNVMMARKPVISSGVLAGYEPLNVNAFEEDDIDQGFKDEYPEDLKHQDGTLYIDNDERANYRLFSMDHFLDVSGLIDRWVDITGLITDQSQIANYIDIMFEILEEVYCFASQSCSIRTHIACREFLECIIKQHVERFDLTGTERRHENTEGTLSAWYSEWIGADSELRGTLNIIDKLPDVASGWNEFNTEIVKKLLEGCTILYAIEAINDSQYAKLKQLVRSLSSYRINFIDNIESGQVCNDTVAITEDALIERIVTTDTIYFDPIGDSTIPPRVGGYEMMDSNWCILVPTSDLRRVAGKTYYTLTYMDSSIYNTPDARQIWHPKARPLGLVNASTPEGTVIPFGCEAINLPAHDEFQFTRRTTDTFVLKNKDYFRYIEESGRYMKAELTDTSCFSAVKKSEVTDPLPEDVLVTKDASENEIVYRVVNAFEELAVGEKLPIGKCFEKINLYSILGLEEGTPLIVLKDENGKWYYRTGTYRVVEHRLTRDSRRHISKDYYIYTKYNQSYRLATDGDFMQDGSFIPNKDYYELSVVPGSAADLTDPNFNAEMYKKGDRFDLMNDFSNETSKKRLDSAIYRINTLIDVIDWSDPIESKELAFWLYPNVNHEFILTESTEPSILIQESEYPEQEQ